ncbi:hypothetical protein CRYUN_Cryun01aG0103800 [Craigia yunnanensis]
MAKQWLVFAAAICFGIWNFGFSWKQQSSAAFFRKIQRLTFDDQINYFITKEKIKAEIGGNDYVNNFLQPFLADGQQYAHDEFVELLTSTLEQQFLLGARKILYHGLGPLGCIPSQRVKSKTGQCLKRANEWVTEFNSKMQKLIKALNKRLPDAQIMLVDTYPAVLDLINHPTVYGFKIANRSCCNVDTSTGGVYAFHIQNCAMYANIMYFGMLFIHQMQQMKRWLRICSPAYLLLLPLLPFHRTHIDLFLKPFHASDCFAYY